MPKELRISLATGVRKKATARPEPDPTPDQIAAAEKAAARQLLSETEWYFIRQQETGAPMPKDVTTARAAAWETLSGE